VCSESLPFELLGYDLIEDRTGISALSNCGGGFPAAFADDEITKCGLIRSFERAKEVQRQLPRDYSKEPHAYCLGDFSQARSSVRAAPACGPLLWVLDRSDPAPMLPVATAAAALQRNPRPATRTVPACFPSTGSGVAARTTPATTFGTTLCTCLINSVERCPGEDAVPLA